MSAAGAVASVSLAAPPDAPANLAVTYNAESILLSWAPSGEASSYNVYRDEQAEGAPAELGRTIVEGERSDAGEPGARFSTDVF